MSDDQNDGVQIVGDISRCSKLVGFSFDIAAGATTIMVLCASSLRLFLCEFLFSQHFFQPVKILLSVLSTFVIVAFESSTCVLVGHELAEMNISTWFIFLFQIMIAFQSMCVFD